MDNVSLPHKDVFLSKDVLDKEKALSRVHHNAELLNRVITLFHNNLIEKKDLIENHLLNEDWEALKVLAHSVKGSGLTIGAQQLGGVSSEMEKAADNKDAALYKHLFEIFKEAVQIFKAQTNSL